ncbi:YbaB/EbfC family DNA-binding protein [Mycobacterium sp. ITM-2016-00316]|uniref:secretion protein EspD n=1 Tax=Mycobacterium sp. ITM-2016-00316 TaxID=2099695 RepID=UPI000CFA2EF4|nr:secretion protein EspD [Mycobacterium sp. ITM-2016-00316]WNG81234.1 YbaB/EbfC family DNA-binding protein [Mycobacterium sp. ITM-2016-00316]
MSGGSWDDDAEADLDSEQQGGELAGLDFSWADDEPRVDATPPGPAVDDDPEVPVFTVTNPSGTVSVTAYLTGPVQRVDLDPSVVKMTERELAEEIRVIAELAQLKARSVMHAFLLEGLARMGHDRSEWSSVLSTVIQLPSPEQAAENMAEVFAARYADDAH